MRCTPLTLSAGTARRAVPESKGPSTPGSLREPFAQHERGRSERGGAERGTSLLEVLVVVTILAVVSAAAVFSVVADPDRRADALARSLRQDLLYARALAIRRGEPISVVFGDYRYSLYDSSGAAVPEPVGGAAPFEVDVRKRAESPSAVIEAADFGGPDPRTLVFGSDGAPAAAGSALVRAGGAARRVRVFAVTGRATIEVP